MQTVKAPVCPKCGHPNPEKLSEHLDSTAGFFAPPADAPKHITAVFRCQCGAAFTDTTVADEPPNPITKSTDDVKTHALAAEATRLQMKIGRLVDDPNRQIVGFEGEAYIAEIRELAARCEAEGLQVAAERLHHLGRDIMRRWAE